jgi:serine/threonine-protein kinase RsbW
VSTSYRATFTSEPRNASLARKSIASFAGLCGFSEDEVAEIRLAAGEALGNAVEHGRSARSSGFSVRCTFDGEMLSIEVRDSGSGFSEEPIQSYDVENTDRGRGLGILIMRRMMDTVAFERGGTLVRLARKHHGERSSIG